MKIRIALTLKLSEEQTKRLAAHARALGHGYDGTKAPGKLIRRLLEDKVYTTVETAGPEFDPGDDE